MPIAQIKNTTIRHAVVIVYLPISIILLAFLGALIGAAEELRDNWRLAKDAWRGDPLSSQERAK